MGDVAINWWALLAAVASTMVIGSLWYGPLFGKMWMRLSGLNRESMKSMPLSALQAMVGGVLSSLVSSYVLFHFVNYFGVFDVGGALSLAFWIWLGFVATMQLGSFLWEGRPFKLFVLNAAQSLVSLSVAAVLLALLS